MPIDQSWKDRLVDRLQDLAERANPPDKTRPPDSRARATLAKLRRAVARFEPAAFGWVMRVGVRKNSEAEADAMLVSALFAHHRISASVSLGGAFRALAGKSKGDGPERRFSALLKAAREDLPTKLRHAVMLLRSHEVGLDWLRLLQDITHWEHPGRKVQRGWARDFWAPIERPATSTENPSDVRETQETSP